MSELEILYPQIPFNAVQLTESDATETGFSGNNLSTGSRSLIHRLDTPAANITNTWKQWDLGYGETDTANYLAIARADLLRSSGCTSVSVRASTVSRNTISDLALSSLKLHLDANKEVTINSTRQVSAWNDQSGNNYDFVQATSGNKPVYSRADNKENLFVQSEDLSTTWGTTNTTISTNQIANPVDGLTTADLVTENGAAGNHRIYQTAVASVYSGISYRISFYAKANGRVALRVYFDTPSAEFNLTNVTATSFGATTSSSIVAVGSDGWYRCTFTAPASSTAALSTSFYLHDAGNNESYTGDSASGMYIWGCQLSEAAADTTYLATTDHQQYRGVNGYPALVFDDTDDLMTSTATLSNVIANNAFTIFMVVQPYDAGSSNVSYFKDSGGYLTIEETTNDIVLRNWDGAYDTISATGETFGSVNILEGRHDSGSIYFKTNNGSETTTASGNTSTLTGTLQIGDTNGIGNKICELLVFNAALTAAQRSSIYTYLATKYTTAAAAQGDIESATLVGPHSQDFVTTFSATTASRYYWLDLNCNTPAVDVLFPFSKAYLGTRYTFSSTDPVYPYGSNYRKPMRDFTANSGTVFRSREGREQLEYAFQWFLDDDTRDDFMDKIGRYWDINPIMLYTPSTGFSAALNDHTLIHGWIDSLNITSTGPVANQNTLTLKVIQDI